MKAKFEEQNSKNGSFDEADSTEDKLLEEPSDQNKQRVKTNSGNTGGDGASIEVVKRRRGRPPGSKNKPKPLVVTNNAAAESDAVMRPYILEISAGHDVIDALVGFSRCRKVGISVLSATGSVSNLSIRQPSTTSAPSIATLMFNGRFEILSISGTVFPPTFVPTFAISVAGPRGQIVGGIVSGPMVASDTTMVIAAVFANPEFVKIPGVDDVSPSGGDDGSGGGGRSEDVVEEQQQQHEYHSHHSNLAEPSMYSRHLPSDVIWPPPPPTHRPPF